MKKILKSKYIPFIIMFFIILLLHFFMDFCGDDLWFAKQLNKYSILDYISYRYNHWSSRIIIESILIVITRLNVNIWRVFDSLFYTIGAFVVINLINKKQKKSINYLGCLIFLIYPLADMSSAGWGATTTNYLWCFCFGMLSFLPLINSDEQNKKNSILTYVIAIAGLIYATNQEQMCALILGYNFVYFIYKIYKKEKINKYNIFCLIVSIISLIVILKCPGNSLRNNSEIAKWYPEFSKYGLIQKSYLGVVSTANVLITNKIIILLFVSILSIGMYIYSKKDYEKVLSVFNIIFVSCITIFKTVLIDAFPMFSNVFDVFSTQGIPTLSDKFSYIPIAISILFVCDIIYMLFVIFKEKQLLPMVIFIAGICSRLIVGFSPTIFISGNRTAFFLYMSIIAIIIFVIYKLYDDKKVTKNEKIVFNSIIMALAIMNLINIFIYI